MKLEIMETLKGINDDLTECETLTRGDKHYLNRIRDINSEVEKLIYDLETHYA